MLAPVVHVQPITQIRRERVLPVPGKVLVRAGQPVSPHDVVAEAHLAPEHLWLNIARGLGVSAEQADKYMQRTAGDNVNEGDLLAGPVGLARRVVRAPVAGRIDIAKNGQILLLVERTPQPLRAGLSGMVTQLIPDRGVVIETSGALIQGVWGNDRTEFGLMQSKLASADSKLTPQQLDMSLRGAIILGGHCEDAKVLQNAADIPLRGLILTSMAAGLVSLAKKMPYPILVLEGFGARVMDTVSYNLLSTSKDREVCLLANTFGRFTGVRPEIVIPLPGAGETSLNVEIEDFGPGMRVRCVRAPQPSAIGTIEALQSGYTAFPSGIRAPAAVVRLENGTAVSLPLANLEIIQ
jgi:hypothetical protein